MYDFFSLLDKEISDDNHALWAMSCDWYAQYLLNNGRYRAALEQFEKAQYIYRVILGRDEFELEFSGSREPEL